MEWLDETNAQVHDKKRKLNPEQNEANEENPFKNHDRNIFWAYCDYKHMIEFLKSDSSLLNENVWLKTDKKLFILNFNWDFEIV